MAEFVNKVKKNDVEYEIRDARIPEADVADAGKVLKVADAGGYELGQAGGGGTQLYRHHLKEVEGMFVGDICCYISSQSEPISSFDELLDVFAKTPFCTNGHIDDESNNVILNWFQVTNAGYPGATTYLYQYELNVTTATINSTSIAFENVTDTVTTL